MHVNVYAEEIGHEVPVRMKTTFKNGLQVYGVDIRLKGEENNLILWSTSKEKLAELFHGLAVLIRIGSTQAVLHVGDPLKGYSMEEKSGAFH